MSTRENIRLIARAPLQMAISKKKTFFRNFTRLSHPHQMHTFEAPSYNIVLDMYIAPRQGKTTPWHQFLFQKI